MIMDRAQFMKQLERLLSDISESERKEALDYYENYFDDAGKENEAEVIRELGSPGKVAAIIKADLKESNEQYAEYTENGYRDTRTEEKNTPARRGYHADGKRSNAPLLLVIILLVFAFPLIKGLAKGILYVLLALVCLPFAVVLGLAAVTLGLLIGAVACVASGIALCFVYLAAGLLSVGVGCLLMAFGIVAVVFDVWLLSCVVPVLIQKFTDFCQRILSKRKVKGGVS